ncbi:DUF3231 family protein [Halalkalibacter okhensis]|uniref:DUF3231 family protein n=1 Tax=Halalkalibacter okhensis TaxID=333138 RepID=A0A0B0IC75_9BACI|nr:DUF3231 family protein [Halalkalibacter okhensis]KHF40193.1 hypothetical protein LQ50_10630 [Halalkalibacter okhensis]
MDKPILTASEIGMLWTQYIQNSMTNQILKYFKLTVEDNDIKFLVEKSLTLIENVKSNIQSVFRSELLPIPYAFSDADINLHAPKLFTDDLILLFIETMGKAGTTAYSLAQATSTRSDIRGLFSTVLVEYSTLLNKTIEVSLEKGLYVRPPSITKPDEVEFIEGKAYFSSGLNPFHKRSLNAVEILHLFENLKTNSIGKVICTGFAQTTDNKEIKNYFLKGKETSEKHAQLFHKLLTESNVPAPVPSDVGVTDSTTRVFSDKLMLFLKSVLSATGQGNYSTASTASMRYDLIGHYQKLSIEVALYAKDGFDILLKNNWLEEPPQSVDRNQLIKKGTQS